MRSIDREYDLVAPGSLSAVLDALAAQTLTPMAGGTELMVALGAGRLPQRNFISIGGLKELRFIDDSDPATLRIGSGTTFTDLRRSAAIARDFSLIAQTASWTGSVANQSRATLGGNIANASPAADTPPALLAYDAQIEIISARGMRTMAYTEFHLGYKKTALAADELIFAVNLPRRFAGYAQWVRKVGTRNAQAISKIALAGVASRDLSDVRIAAASLQDRPARLVATEAALQGGCLSDSLIAKARAALAGEVKPIDDIRSTANYRAAVAGNLLEEFLRSL